VTTIIHPNDRKSFDPINPSASMANLKPRIPETQINPVRIERLAKAGPRQFDARLGAWIAPEPRLYPQHRNTRRMKPLPDTYGMKRFDVLDTTTNVRLGVLKADVITIALRIAHAWARENGFTAQDVYLRETER
jgi:hypothetical protein